MPIDTAGDDDLVTRARSFAIDAHQRINHRRKYSDAPYDVHLRSVHRIVAAVTDDAEMLAAAWLHDIVEDTAVTVDDVVAAFGPGVAQLVAELTDVSNPRDGNRAARKAIDRAHLARASPRAKTIKLADLCDNAVDICEADPRFGRIYLAEMRELLDVLREGDPRIHARARSILERYERGLGMHAPAEGSPRQQAVDEAQVAELDAVVRMLDTFRVGDLARPLYSVDEDRDARHLQELVGDKPWDLVGYRRAGKVVAYARIGAVGTGREIGPARPIEPNQVVGGDATLSSLVHLLTRHDFAFVRHYGEIGGVVSREDFERPIGRMWLFGMVTLIESDFAKRIRSVWPGGEWRDLLSPGRLEKARQLLDERRRKGSAVDLLDCLQLGDKAAILIRDPGQLAALGFRTKGAAKDAIGDLESLRNHLAHSQALVANYWHQIARLTHRFDEGIAELSARMGQEP